MKFPGTWMDVDSKVVYRVTPKCACSTIGQLIYFGSHGNYYDGDIHDAQDGIVKWNMEDQRPRIVETITDGDPFVFTSVRNPYSRILSSFMDKIAGIQRNGQRYRADLVPNLRRDYGVDVESEDFDQIRAFRRFLLFVRDTIIFKRPMNADIHWSPTASHIATLIENGGRYDAIIHTENMDQKLPEIFSSFEQKYPVNLDPIPRFNESEGHGPKQAHALHEYFDDLAQHIVRQIYPLDFELFKYDVDPTNKKPVGEIDLDLVHARLSGH